MTENSESCGYLDQLRFGGVRNGSGHLGDDGERGGGREKERDVMFQSMLFEKID